METINSAGARFVSVLGVENKNKVFLCICPKCGKEYRTFASEYYSGKVSCDCKWLGKANKRLYSIWINMKTRCYNPNVKGYKDYGGRGITICDEWKDSFKAFYEWSISNGYQDDLTIDRISVNGNYEPNNCRWADKYEQAGNKTNTVYVYGVPLKVYCRMKGINYKTVHTMKSRHPEMSIESIVDRYVIKELDDEQPVP